MFKALERPLGKADKRQEVYTKLREAVGMKNAESVREFDLENPDDRSLFQGNPPQWSQRQQQNAPPKRIYSTTGGRTGRRGKLITFYGTANNIPIRALWDPGADSIYVSKRVVETGKFCSSALEPSTCKEGIRLDGMQALLTTV
uniref:Uncharacterized protein n=1 Tax=Chromera velia CCMP2878 TaxID=1169474 RepID=A0A0G4F597_9ALVE|eukprot:Cvel_15174.t1-p1 / transcript=Cvel_15174.t1 / gene=Cvel_15174 / organism=Chromera_velia_CCMP2878 / gene_product=hypothetical protein / transcript_product=hypothetical protein / location=Cvel_scaffold1109:10322-12740(-) / protein_length=143 / sequence_SO=supercontig / SO=protein_coding / is_pseudo=false